jgi:serine/threonine protein kinase
MPHDLIKANVASWAWPHSSLDFQVFKGRRRATGQITAMKFISKQGKSEKDLKNLEKEIDILRKLKHENIIQMLDTYETPQEVCVITEFAQGEFIAPSGAGPCTGLLQRSPTPIAFQASSSKSWRTTRNCQRRSFNGYQSSLSVRCSTCTRTTSYTET